jgi:hypothetical protein
MSSLGTHGLLQLPHAKDQQPTLHTARGEANCDIVEKEDIHGVVRYLVEWNPTLVPKYARKNAKEMVNKLETRL